MSKSTTTPATLAIAGGPSIELVYEAIEDARLEAIRSSAQRLLETMEADDHCECVWSLSDSIWPARALAEYKATPTKNTTLFLLPLSRIGQMEGKSGSLVLIGYFADKTAPDLPCSHPIVIKTMPALGSKLRDEYKNAVAVKPFAYDQKDVFAIPFRFDDQSPEFHVLWSIFSASEPSWYTGLAVPNIVVKDLREPLKRSDEQTVNEVLTRAMSALATFHRSFGRQFVEERNIYTEYEWYLRQFGTAWGPEWIDVWGDSSHRLCQLDGTDVVNPIWVLDRLRTKTLPLTVGAIHGDLHPGNIVLGQNNGARIIDFGWSQERSHIAKDFVLMECNLRFLFLRPQLSAGESRTFSRWLKWDEPVPPGLSDHCVRHANMIKHLRSLATNVFPANPDWNWQYLVPMFFVAFGLLRFAPQLGNQSAAVETVLGLAQEIDALLASPIKTSTV